MSCPKTSRARHTFARTCPTNSCCTTPSSWYTDLVCCDPNEFVFPPNHQDFLKLCTVLTTAFPASFASYDELVIFMLDYPWPTISGPYAVFLTESVLGIFEQIGVVNQGYFTSYSIGPYPPGTEYLVTIEDPDGIGSPCGTSFFPMG